MSHKRSCQNNGVLWKAFGVKSDDEDEIEPTYENGYGTRPCIPGPSSLSSFRTEQSEKYNFMVDDIGCLPAEGRFYLHSAQVDDEGNSRFLPLQFEAHEEPSGKGKGKEKAIPNRPLKLHIYSPHVRGSLPSDSGSFESPFCMRREKERPGKGNAKDDEISRSPGVGARNSEPFPVDAIYGVPIRPPAARLAPPFLGDSRHSAKKIPKFQEGTDVQRDRIHKRQRKD